MTDAAVKRETCPHFRAEVAPPGSTWRRGVGWRTKYRCPDCGAWWIEERAEDSAERKR
jgi:hypothetical protein